MLTDRQIKLATKNGKQEAAYEQEIVEEIRSKYPSSNNELAILRKEVAALRAMVEQLTSIIPTNTEFDEYNNYVEFCKEKAKRRVGK